AVAPARDGDYEGALVLAAHGMHSSQALLMACDDPLEAEPDHPRPGSAGWRPRVLPRYGSARRQTQVHPQRRPGVLGGIDTPVLQPGDEVIDDVVQARGDQPRGDVQPVA